MHIKVLVVSDLKKELGYCNTPGHRAWRNVSNDLQYNITLHFVSGLISFSAIITVLHECSQVLKRLKDACLVEELIATVNEKVVLAILLLLYL